MVLDENNKKEALKKLTKDTMSRRMRQRNILLLVSMTIFMKRESTLMWCQVSRCFLARISMMRDAAGLVLPGRLRN